MGYDLAVAYCLQGKSMKQIANELGCAPLTVRKRLLKLGIQPQPRGARLQQAPPSKELLEHHYLTLKQSCSQIGRFLNRSASAVEHWVMKYGIPLRSRSEAIHLATGAQVELSPNVVTFIEGELLGDGTLFGASPWSARYCHGSKHAEYIEWLTDAFAAEGLERAGGGGPYNPGFGAIYTYQTRDYAALRPLRDRWYPDGKKHVPADLILTPLRARQWYIGDGSYYPTKPGHQAHIVIYTMGFAVPEVEALVAQLNELGFLATRQPSSNVIHISAKSTADFLDWIGPCPEPIKDIYGYKWAA